MTIPLTNPLPATPGATEATITKIVFYPVQRELQIETDLSPGNPQAVLDGDACAPVEAFFEGMVAQLQNVVDRVAASKGAVPLGKL